MSSLSWQKKFNVSICFVILAGCQTVKTRDELRKSKSPVKATVVVSAQAAPQAPSVEIPPETPTTTTESVSEIEPQDQVPVLPPPPPVVPAIPKIGIILGAGGAKTYAHIAFLHEISRAKIPVFAIGGIEFAAPMAALYANKEQANEVEWQMFKLKEEDVARKNLLGAQTSNVDIGSIREFLSGAFSRMRIDDFRIPFACPSVNLKKNQVYLMNRGGLEQVLSLCLAYPPYFKPYQESISGIREVTALANYLRSKGANHIILVNVLEAPNGIRSYVHDMNGTNNLLWNEIAATYNRPAPGVDTLISLDTGGYGIMDFDKRREIMNKGAEASARQIKNLMHKLGL